MCDELFFLFVFLLQNVFSNDIMNAVCFLQSEKKLWEATLWEKYPEQYDISIEVLLGSKPLKSPSFPFWCFEAIILLNVN